MKRRIRVYVAGAYSADNVLSVLQNIGRGEKACAKLFRLGFAPFCPWHDKSYVIDNPDTNFSVRDFHEHSTAWLEVSDIILVLKKSEYSYGTTMEIERAKRLKIPVCYSIDEVVNFSAFFNHTTQGK